MNRAGRKRLMFQAIRAHDLRHKDGALVTAKVAHRAGLKSSTAVLAMLRELAAEGLIREVYIEPSYSCGYYHRAWCIARYEQLPLPSNYITINGKKYNKFTGVECDASI